jgi:hypothetical protein
MASSSSVAHRYAQNRTGFGAEAPVRMTMPTGSGCAAGAMDESLVTGLLLTLGKWTYSAPRGAAFVPRGGTTKLIG